MRAGFEVNVVSGSRKDRTAFGAAADVQLYAFDAEDLAGHDGSGADVLGGRKLDGGCRSGDAAEASGSDAAEAGTRRTADQTANAEADRVAERPALILIVLLKRVESENGGDGERQRLHIAAIALAGVEKQSDLRGMSGFGVRGGGNDAALKDGAFAQIALGALPLLGYFGEDSVADLGTGGIYGANDLDLDGDAGLVLGESEGRAKQ